MNAQEQELAQFVNGRVGWLNAASRVNGIMQLVEFTLDRPEVPTVILSGKVLKQTGAGIGNRLGNLPP